MNLLRCLQHSCPKTQSTLVGQLLQLCRFQIMQCCTFLFLSVNKHSAVNYLSTSYTTASVQHLQMGVMKPCNNLASCSEGFASGRQQFWLLTGRQHMFNCFPERRLKLGAFVRGFWLSVRLLTEGGILCLSRCWNVSLEFLHSVNKHFDCCMVH